MLKTARRGGRRGRRGGGLGGAALVVAGAAEAVPAARAAQARSAAEAAAEVLAEARLVGSSQQLVSLRLGDHAVGDGLLHRRAVSGGQRRLELAVILEGEAPLGQV